MVRHWLLLGLVALVFLLSLNTVVCEDEDLPEEFAAEGHEGALDDEGEDEPKNKPADGKNMDSMSDEEKEALGKSSENYEFQAEVNRLMDIIINSLYTQKEVFLRETISNAADALEKVRYLSVTDEAVLGDKKDLDIRIEWDSEAKTLSLTDTGIGMTKQDLINNLGTVAKSGTTNFLEAVAGGADVNLIGQFGVGFYSTFLVADKVTVTSKHHDDEQHIWESTADANFRIAKDPRGDTLGRGTRITMHLKEDSTEFLNEYKLRDLAKKFSQFISFPIYLRVEKSKTEEVPVEAEDEEDKKEEDVEVKEEEEGDEGEDKKEKKKKTKSVTKKYWEWEQLNTQKAIWLRPKEEVTDTEYKEFYKSTTKDYQDPLAYTHFNAEGEIEFKSILYIPGRAPMDMFDNYFKQQSQLKLYVRRVLVADQFEDLMPKYLHFMRGVVDSDDLPLNVNREQLQQHKVMKVISKKLVRKTLELFKKLAKEADKKKEEEEEEEEAEGEKEKKDEKPKKDEKSRFDKFYYQFSRNLKLGCYEDDSNRAKIVKLLRFHTSKSLDKQIGLDDYVDRMQENQDTIYYMAGESTDQLMKSPHMQAFKKRDLEVVFLTESMDEPCFQKMLDFEGKKLVSIQKGDIKFDESEDDKKRDKKLKEMYEPLMKWWKNHLKDKIQKVELSKRLVEDPVAVVASQWGYSAYMEKIMKSQAFANNNEVKMMAGQKVLEINPNHPVIKSLLEKIKADEEDKGAKATASMLFDSAMLASGFDVENPTDMAAKLYRYLSMDIGVDPEAPIEEVDVGPLDEDEDEDEEEGDKPSSDAEADVEELIKKAQEKMGDMEGGEEEGGSESTEAPGHDEL
ncbi:unnamed protein product [Vitrella brassicaformis CCMP3155]|uniref:Histidine kinase/HSP90-like ATPase domain-containing protein n=2 Tax=Vitrella brassicaformis TaxID=1169539 RepID=A0A0G4EDS5_VITBC|nr:unnamed protein product [Vitrella brassicaformis CCMP3155]|eukprot:CEL93682.1 unnamed protein product [Vitrella brassicaformis CCMP3155]